MEFGFEGESRRRLGINAENEKGLAMHLGALLCNEPIFRICCRPTARLQPNPIVRSDRNHDHAARLSNSPFVEASDAKVAEDDVMVLVHGYLADV